MIILLAEGILESMVDEDSELITIFLWQRCR